MVPTLADGCGENPHPPAWKVEGLSPQIRIGSWASEKKMLYLTPVFCIFLPGSFWFCAHSARSQCCQLDTWLPCPCVWTPEHGWIADGPGPEPPRFTPSCPSPYVGVRIMTRPYLRIPGSPAQDQPGHALGVPGWASTMENTEACRSSCKSIHLSSRWRVLPPRLGVFRIHGLRRWLCLDSVTDHAQAAPETVSTGFGGIGCKFLCKAMRQ